MSKSIIIPLAAVAWLSAGMLSAGFVNNNFKAEFCDYDFFRSGGQQRDLRSFEIVGIIGGPIALLSSFVFSGGGYDGWSLSGCHE